jgi:(heptosyl)LPS beta-1,4-glucosyltransferase
MLSKKDNNSTVTTLGVVAISYNEERDIEGFIAHLLPWVDEIVIIDDGSTDRTAQIAAKSNHKVNFIVSPRKAGEFFSHQRNKGIAASTCERLLHMSWPKILYGQFAMIVKMHTDTGA